MELQAIWVSLRVASLATLLMLPLALATAYALSRGRFWGRGVLDVVIHVPLVLPPVMTGYLLLVVFGKNGPVGSVLDAWGLGLAFTTTGAAVASGIMAFPLIVRPIRIALDAVDPKLEAAASTLGAPPWGVFWGVTFPLIRSGFLAGAVLGFAKALGEFGATITFVSNIPGKTQTIASAVYAMLQVPGGDAGVWRLLLVSLFLSVLALAASERLARAGARR